MRYIAETLGIEVINEQWEANIPYYLSDIYNFQKLKVGNVACLLVKPKSELLAINAVKKHLEKIAQIADLPLILEIETLNARQRKALIAGNIPFVMDGVQLYLPFIGAALQERYPAPKPQGSALMPTSQMILFCYLYRKEQEMYASGLANLLGVSAMQVTRAVKQLTALGLFKMHKDGVQIVLAGIEDGLELFKKSKPYLQTPVKKRIYVERDVLPQQLTLAGESALAGYTMLNPPIVTTFAFDGNVGVLTGTKSLVDADTQAEVEFWRYSPATLSKKDGYADPLSLWVTLPDGDPRMEIAKDELLAGIWG